MPDKPIPKGLSLSEAKGKKKNPPAPPYKEKRG
jgi:hypothetical protein